MKPEWQAVLDEIATRDPVITDEPYGLMDAVAYSVELRTRISELEAGLREIYETATWAIEDSPAAKREGRGINPKWVADLCVALLDGRGE